MKTNYKQIWSIWACLLVLIAGSCSTDDIINNKIGSTLIEGDGYRISTFTLPKGPWELSKTELTLDFLLRSLSDNRTLTYEGKLKKQLENFACDLYIPMDEEIADGDYILSLRFAEEEHAYPQSYHLTFLNNMVDAVQEVNTPYDQLEGKGSEEEPYQIRSVEDFAYFVSQLVLYDATYGYGKHFQQTTDIQSPQTHCLYQGKAYKSAPFAGIYNGGSHKISNLTYTGSSSNPEEDPVGLFSILHDGATIRNLKIEDANIQSPGSCCGLIAGKAQGKVVIENVKVGGEIEKGIDKIGGLIGYMEGSKDTAGELVLKNITFQVTLSDNKNEVGGLIGYAENVNITAENINTPTEGSSSPILRSIKGDMYVGGLIGKLHGQINANNIKIAHSMETPDPFIISGGNAVGGVIGELLQHGSSSTFKDIVVQLPIQGTDAVGGLAGRISSTVTDKSVIKIENFQSPIGTCQIKGDRYTGGLIGQADLSGQNALKIQLSGSSLLTAEVISSTGYAGSAFGMLNNVEIAFDPSSTLNINSPLIKADAYCGGLVGSIRGCREVSLNNLSISPFIEIKGEYSVGGIAGALMDGTLKGNYTPIFSETDVITNKNPTPQFAGKINNDPSYWGAIYVGGAIGKTENATVKNIFIAASIYGNTGIGGVIGQANETNISNCGSHCSTFNNNGLSPASQGGIVGFIINTKKTIYLDNLVNFSPIGPNGSKSGGLIGYIETSYSIHLSKSVNLANITAKGNVGGLIGSILGYGNLFIEQCANFGAIEGDTKEKKQGIGGFIGFADNFLWVTYSVNHGDVTAKKDANYYGAGGIIGYNESRGVKIKFSCNRANIHFEKSKENNYGVGGLVGTIHDASLSDGTIENSYNLGGVYGQKKATTPLVGTDYRGGIAGSIDKHVKCDRCINGGNIGFGNAGVGKGTKEYLTNLYVLEGTGGTWAATVVSYNNRNKQTSYPALDFKTPIWIVDGKSNTDNNGLPYLNPKNCYFQFAKYVP